jgi:hypothetical protein
MAYQSYAEEHAASHNLRQVAHSTASTEAQHKQADIDHYKRLLTAAHTWSVKNGAMQALINLGVSVQPLGGEV